MHGEKKCFFHFSQIDIKETLYLQNHIRNTSRRPLPHHPHSILFLRHFFLKLKFRKMYSTGTAPPPHYAFCDSVLKIGKFITVLNITPRIGNLRVGVDIYF